MAKQKSKSEGAESGRGRKAAAPEVATSGPEAGSDAGAGPGPGSRSASGSGASAAAASPPVGQGAAGGYTVLARRYRSREFDELVGQEAVVRTLRNAIAHNRVAHAYLFTGTRGVGKTSAARLLAQELCRHPRRDASGKVIAEVPAEIEAIGQAILRGSDLDVIEIDAASNTGVDNVRDLIASAGLVPARCPYKVYIIDEVHMLSKSAFNALLKIMEEPPPHVKFILCTTEPQKVPATIQSRCQRFDFRGIPPARIAAHLRSVLDREGFAYEEEAVLQVARLAAGSMRDALTLLDRLLAAADGTLNGHLVETMLGLPDASVVNALIDAVAAGDPRGALLQGDELIQRGNTVDRAIDALVEHFRGLMVLSVCGGDSPLFEGGSEARAVAAGQAARFDAVGLVHRIAQCEAASRAARGASAPRAIFDALLVRLATADQFVPASQALAQIDPGEKKNGERLGRPAVTPPGSTGPGKAGPDAAGPDSSAPSKRDGRAAARLVTPVAAEPAAPPRPAPAAAPSPSRIAAAPAEASPRPPSGAADPPAATQWAGPERASTAAPPATSAAGHAAPVEVPRDLESLWQAMQAIASRAMDAALLAALRPVAFDGRTLRLAPATQDGALATSVASQSERLADIARRAAQTRIVVTIDAPTQAPVAAPRGAGLEAARNHPLVREAMQLFDAVVSGVDAGGRRPVNSPQPPTEP